MTTQLIRGDDWRLRGVYGEVVNDVFSPLTISGMTIASEMRKGAEVVTFTVVDRESEDGTGSFWLVADDSITLVEAGNWLHDLEFIINGQKTSTLTRTITVLSDVTNAS